MRRLTKVDLLLLAVVLIWGSVFSVIKYTLQEIGPLAFATARFLGASIFLLALVYLVEGKPIIEREDWLRVGVVGIIGIGFYQILFTLGLNYTTASNSSLLIATGPIFTLLFAVLFREERIVPLQIVGILVSFLGVGMIVGVHSGGLTLSVEDLKGDLFTLICAAINGLCAVISKRPLKRLSSLRLMTVSFVLGTLSMLPFTWRALLYQPWAHLSLHGWLGLGYSAVLAGGVGYVIWFQAIGEIGATRTMIYNYLIPVVAVGVAVLTLGEHLTPLQALGALIVFVGIALARLAPRRGEPALIMGGGDGDRG
ncbi:MAG: DMT family transporter [Anaerolineae bacterium]